MISLRLFVVAIALAIGVLRIDAQDHPCVGSVACELVHRGGRSVMATFVSLHADEQTAIQAFRAIRADSTRVGLFTFGRSGQRLAVLDHRGVRYRYDPNRIFTVEGVRATLRLYNGEAPPPVVDRLTAIADSVLTRITPTGRDGVIIALHNNTEGALSVHSFVASPDAAEVHVAPGADPDDFIFVTRRPDFEFFRSRGRNVVLQGPGVRDDGSLSVRCQRLGIPYINVEAQHGRQREQERMLLEAYTHIIGGSR